MNTTLRSLLATAGFIAIACGTSAQTIIVQDTFTLNGTTRTVSTQLAGLAPEQGSGAWVSSYFASNSIFSSDGTIVRAANSTTEARIAIPTPTNITTIQADFTGINGGWSSIGFTNTATSTNAGAWSAPNFGTALWVRVQAGQYFIDVNGTSYQVASGTITGFSYAKVYTVSLSYNPIPDNYQVSLDISTGGSTVVSTGWLSISDLSSAAATYLETAIIGAAGFHLEGAQIPSDTNTISMDNFSVSAIPEPATAALYMGAALGLLAFVKLRR